MPVNVKRSKVGIRRTLPKIDAMLEWGVIKEGALLLQSIEAMKRLFWQMETSW
jgi:hypothetical protein